MFAGAVSAPIFGPHSKPPEAWQILAEGDCPIEPGKCKETMEDLREKFVSRSFLGQLCSIFSGAGIPVRCSPTKCMPPYTALVRVRWILAGTLGFCYTTGCFAGLPAITGAGLYLPIFFRMPHYAAKEWSLGCTAVPWKGRPTALGATAEPRRAAAGPAWFAPGHGGRLPRHSA